MNAPQPSASPPLIGSRGEFLAAIAWGWQSAVAQGARRMMWIDNDFSDWPLDDAALLEGLGDWLHRPQRRLVMLARDWSSMRPTHARFCAWRPAYAHAVETRTPDDEDAAELPTMLLDDTRVCVRLVDRVHWRGRCSLDARDTRLLFAEFDALAQRSSHDFPVTRLGL